MKSYPRPTDELVDKTLKKLTSIQLRRHFFGKLENPSWAEILLARGCFNKAPAPLKEGNATRFTDWPELEYLERVTKDVPEVAFKAISGIDTDNYFVHKTAIEIAAKLPVNLAARFTQETLTTWFADTISPFAVDPLLELSKFLAKEKHEAALDVADKLLLAYYKDENATYERIKSKVWQDWNFDEAVEKLQKPLTDSFGVRYLEILCFKLKQILILEDGLQQGRSLFWRNAVEEDAQDKYRKDIKSTLLDSIRDVSMLLLEADSDKVFEMLEKFPLSVFRRVEIYIAGASGKMIDSQSERFLKSPEFFWEMDFQHEIYHFLRQQFVNLRPEQQAGILRIISQGPLEEGEEVAIQSEKFRKYDAIKDHLSGVYKEEYESLPPVSYPDHLMHMDVGWVGPTSPITEEQLANYTAADVARFLKEWKPADGWREATPRGLGRMLEEDVKKSPSKYIDNLVLFQMEQPTYVGHILGGIMGVDKAMFDEKAWNNILCLCEWLVARPIKIADRNTSNNFDDDPDWQWSRRKVVSLLNARMRTAPLSFRERIWTLIALISQDDDPTQEEENKSLKSNQSPYGLAINSTKGDALSAAVEYGLWLRNVDAAIATPELFALLDKKVANDFDGLRSQMAVFGRYYPWLHLLSPEWAEKNKDAVFPENDVRKFAASWESYISHCDVYNAMLPLLMEKYLFSLKQQDKIKADHNYYVSRLASHIATFYLRGLVKLDTPIMKKLFSGETEGHIFDFLGRCVTGKDVPPEVVARAAALWDNYINEKVKGKSLTDSQKKTLSDFSYWIESDYLDTSWKLDHLEHLLSIGVKLKDAHGIVEGLQKVTTTHLLQVLIILKKIISSNVIEYFVTMHREEIHMILKAGSSSADGNINKAVIKLVNVLGEKGYKGYEQYLKLTN